MELKKTSKLIVMGVGEYVLTFLIFYAFTVALHEWFHLSVAQYFGGVGTIHKTWYGGVVKYTTSPSYPFLTALAGGIGVALFYFLLFFLDWLDDIEQAAALFPLATSQLAYGIAEGAIFPFVTLGEFYNIAQIALAIGWLVGMIPSVYWLLKSLASHIKSN